MNRWPSDEKEKFKKNSRRIMNPYNDPEKYATFTYSETVEAQDKKLVKLRMCFVVSPERLGQLRWWSTKIERVRVVKLYVIRDTQQKGRPITRVVGSGQVAAEILKLTKFIKNARKTGDRLVNDNFHYISLSYGFQKPMYFKTFDMNKSIRLLE